MSVNLLDLAKGAIGNQVMGQLGGILGENEQKTQTAVGAALPALLGGLMKKASTNDGANELFKTLDDHDGGILDNLGGMLGGGNHSGLLNAGSGILGMIFGNKQSSMLGTIAKMAGLGDSKITTLLSLLAPVVMGILGKQRRSQNLDASGLANMLSSQKEHLGGHLKGELAESLGLGNLLADVKGAGASAANAVGNAGRATAGAVGDAGRATADAGKAGGSMLMSLLPLILLLGVAFLGYKMFFSGGAKDAIDEVEVPNLTVNTDGLSVPDLNVPDMSNLNLNIPGFDAGKITETFGGLTSSIAGVKDVASAQELLPKLSDASSMIDGLDLGAIAGGPQKEVVGGMLGGLVSKLKAALETAYAIPGVEGVLKPVVDPFLQKFAAFGI